MQLFSYLRIKFNVPVNEYYKDNFPCPRYHGVLENQGGGTEDLQHTGTCLVQVFNL